jgi:hypothetical protein
VAAREEYRRHRSKLYEAMGEALGRSGRAAASLRYLRRAVLLDPKGGARVRLGRGLVAAGRGREALDVLLQPGIALDAESRAAASQAADLAGIASLQSELDRVRLLGVPAEARPEFRDGPPRFPDRARLSTGEPFAGDPADTTLLYLADASCRTCSADLLDLKRLVPPGVHLVLMPAVPDQDAALRSVVALYRYRWPYLASGGSAAAQGWPAPAVVALARSGFSIAVARPPFASSLPPLLEVLQKKDAAETLPRAGWNRLPVERAAARPLPALLPNGLAPGDDEPFPEAFVRASAALDARRPAEALALVEGLAKAEEAWLLSPEARYDRAVCLIAAGRREEARRLLLRIGDSRFQDAVDRALESEGTARRP